jgi:hypothetical protein
MTRPYYSFGLGADAPPAAPTESFWRQHGASIIVGTITAVTGTLAVYFITKALQDDTPAYRRRLAARGPYRY